MFTGFVHTYIFHFEKYLSSHEQMKSHTFDIKRNLFLCPHQKIFHSPDSIGFPEILMYMWTAQQTQMETYSFFFRLLMMVVFKITRAMKRRLKLNPQYFRRRTETQHKIKRGEKLQTKTSMCYDHDKSQRKTLIFRYQKTY